MPKYIFITGGVLSGLGKGSLTASIAKLLQLSNKKVSCMKIDPYLNVDAGTMNPLVHGEVFVTEDGGECDMDIGTYERFLNITLTKRHNLTTGQVYLSVIKAERRGDYLGRCVQIIPHITDEIKSRIRELGKDEDILLVECGGTVGDIEGLPFLEAFRQMKLEEGEENVFFIHLTLAPVLKPSNEIKTKPTQHSVQELRRIGIQPDMIVVRSEMPLSEEAKRKISLFTNVPLDAVISNPDLENVYELPLLLYREGVLKPIVRKLNLGNVSPDLTKWEEIVMRMKNARETVKIGMIGKYTKLVDSYVSLNHAILHAGAKLGIKPIIEWVDSEEVERSGVSMLKSYDAIIIPGGFGKRGSEGKIMAIDFARKAKKPFFGICFGFQLSVVSFARNVLGLKEANSTELDPNTPHPVIDLLPEQREIKEMGATMRLGAHEIRVREGTLAWNIYRKNRIWKRHRHRYEVNPRYIELLEKGGLIFSGSSDNGRRQEILELPDHPFYLATQYHPEFSSRLENPEPIFVSLLEAALKARGSKD